MSSFKVWLARSHLSSSKRKDLEDHFSFRTKLSYNDRINENIRLKRLNQSVHSSEARLNRDLILLERGIDRISSETPTQMQDDHNDSVQFLGAQSINIRPDDKYSRPKSSVARINSSRFDQENRDKKDVHTKGNEYNNTNYHINSNEFTNVNLHDYEKILYSRTTNEPPNLPQRSMTTNSRVHNSYLPYTSTQDHSTNTDDVFTPKTEHISAKSTMSTNLPNVVYTKSRDNKYNKPKINFDTDFSQDMYTTSSNYAQREIAKTFNISIDRPPKYHKKDLPWHLLLKYGEEQERKRADSEKQQRQRMMKQQMEYATIQLAEKEKQKYDDKLQLKIEKQQIDSEFKKYNEDQRREKELLRIKSLNDNNDRLSQIKYKETSQQEEKERQLLYEKKLIENNEKLNSIHEDIEKCKKDEKRQQAFEIMKQNELFRNENKNKSLIESRNEMNQMESFSNKLESEGKIRKEKFLTLFNRPENEAEKHYRELEIEKVRKLEDYEKREEMSNKLHEINKQKERDDAVKKRYNMEIDARKSQLNQIKQKEILRPKIKNMDREYMKRCIDDDQNQLKIASDKHFKKRQHEIQDSKFLKSQKDDWNRRNDHEDAGSITKDEVLINCKAFTNISRNIRNYLK